MIRIQNICNKDHHPSPDRRGYPTARIGKAGRSAAGESGARSMSREPDTAPK